MLHAFPHISTATVELGRTDIQLFTGSGESNHRQILTIQLIKCNNKHFDKLSRMGNTACYRPHHSDLHLLLSMTVLSFIIINGFFTPFSIIFAPSAVTHLPNTMFLVELQYFIVFRSRRNFSASALVNHLSPASVNGINLYVCVFHAPENTCEDIELNSWALEFCEPATSSESIRQSLPINQFRLTYVELWSLEERGSKSKCDQNYDRYVWQALPIHRHAIRGFIENLFYYFDLRAAYTFHVRPKAYVIFFFATIIYDTHVPRILGSKLLAWYSSFAHIYFYSIGRDVCDTQERAHRHSINE